MPREYRPFTITVGEASNGQYLLSAEFQTAIWSERIPVELPLLTEQELQRAMRWLETGFIDRDYARDFGGRLFDTLFTGRIREAFRAAYERVAPECGLKVVLILPVVLIGVPWELMYDAETHGFLARSSTAPLVRSFPSPSLPHEAPKEGPLRVLVATASPQGYPPISSEQEAEELNQILGGRKLAPFDALKLGWQHFIRTRSIRSTIDRLRQRNLVEIDRLSHATRDSLQDRILAAHSAGRPHHVVHFIGHGQVDDGGASLVLEGSRGETQLCSAEEFGELVSDSAVNLVVLNSCQTAAPVDLFNGIAQIALRRGVPAVIGMQVPIADRAAVEFAREYYGSWAAGESIEGALAYARRLISTETPGAAADWGIPVLYMRPVEGLRLDLHPAASAWLPKWVVAFLSVLFVLAFTVGPGLSAWAEIIDETRSLGPKVMTCPFNVAVENFEVLNDGTSTDGARRQLGSAIAETIVEELRKTDSDVCVQQISRIGQDTSDSARAYNAHIVISGTVGVKGGVYYVVPGLYLNPQIWAHAPQIPELSGASTFGKGVELRKLSVPVRESDPRLGSALKDKLEDALLPRTKVIHELVLALSAYDGVEHQDAMNHLAGALEQSTEGEGQELIYLWVGSVALDYENQSTLVSGSCKPAADQAGAVPPNLKKKGRSTTDSPLICPPELAAPGSDGLECARAAYTKALDLNPSFARAYIGLGNLHNTIAKAGIDCREYEMAVADYKRALDADMETHKDAYAALRANLYAGITYMDAMRSPDCRTKEYTPAAIASLQKAVDAYTETLTSPPCWSAADGIFDCLTKALGWKKSVDVEPFVLELGFRSYYQLGLALMEDGRYSQASEAFASAIKVAGPTPQKNEHSWQSSRWTAYTQRGFAQLGEANDSSRCQAALDSFNRVIEQYGRQRTEVEVMQLAVVGDAYLGAGMTYERLNEFDQARQSYAKVLALKPEDVCSETVESARRQLERLSDKRSWEPVFGARRML